MSTRQDVRKMRKIKGKFTRLNRPSPRFPLAARLTRMSQGCDTHVAYSPDMLGGPIDRAAWAREIAALIVRFDPGSKGDGNKSAFATRIGRTRQTVIRWLAEETDISQDSVRQVLDRLVLSPREQAELLTRVGYLTAPSELPERPTIPDPYKDEVIQRILANTDLTKAERAELVDEQLDRIEADLQRRQEEYERQLRRLEARRNAS
jgi:hypothetical protein